jgi:hypothetical protein
MYYVEEERSIKDASEVSVLRVRRCHLLRNEQLRNEQTRDFMLSCTYVKSTKVVLMVWVETRVKQL